MHRPQRMPGQPDFEKMRDMTPEEKTQYFQQLLEEQRKAMERQESIAMRQALGANDEQWKIIEPRLKKVRRCREQAFIGTKSPFQSNFSSFSTGPGGTQGFGGGFQFQAGGGFASPGGTFQSLPARRDFDGPVSDGEIICEEIQTLLNDPQATPEQIGRKLDALRQEREKARLQLISTTV